MAERGDFTIVHEPFSLVTDFGEATIGDRIVQSQCDVVDALRALAQDAPVFFKDTTDFHYPALLSDRAFLRQAVHTFIIRHPAEAIASHFALNADLNRDEIGFGRLYEIFRHVRDETGKSPLVIDSDDLLNHPAETVRKYCAAVGIPFLPDALSWDPGMRSEWQTTNRWHETTSKTSGFDQGARKASDALDLIAANPKLQSFVEYHEVFYYKLRSAKLRV